MAASSHEMAAQLTNQDIVAHEARIESLATKDGCLDCVGDGSFRIAKKVVKKAADGAPLARPGLRAEVHYTGYLAPAAAGAAPTLDDALIAASTKARPFDSSQNRGALFGFLVGGRQVIPGWDASVATMRVGERAWVLVAPEQGYGDRGAGGVIPPGAWLLFDIEVFKAEPETPVAFNTPSLVGGLFALLIVIYYCFIFDPSPDGQEL